MSQAAERRRYSRVDFNTQVTITQHDKSCQADLLDISLNGLLVKTPEHYEINASHPLIATIPLSNDAHIRMNVSLAHSSHNILGFRNESIDIDSIGHLRRLIELNLGEADAAERVLSELLADI
ncbi:PilZ domain-containing protein [Teredinibacter franksiae]|uniref:PilZ domain-containing protein n=1 Tax=Teredinibacter franksiae TaxID=2761453 RepID=UPI001623B6C5|nr:PilZ domain-containing protein [Teredinibacter franksiae]